MMVDHLLWPVLRVLVKDPDTPRWLHRRAMVIVHAERHRGICPVCPVISITLLLGMPLLAWVLQRFFPEISWDVCMVVFPSMLLAALYLLIEEMCEGVQLLKAFRTDYGLALIEARKTLTGHDRMRSLDTRSWMSSLALFRRSCQGMVNRRPHTISQEEGNQVG